MEFSNSSFSYLETTLDPSNTPNPANLSERNQTSSLNQTLMVIQQIGKCIGPPILSFGIISNILTFLTLQQPKLKESPYIHLAGLALANLTALVLILIELHHDPNNKIWLQFRAKVHYPLCNTAICMGIWTIVIMTLERCICIQFPLWMPIRCTTSSAKLKILLVFLASCLLNFPRFFWFKVSPNNSTSAPYAIEDSLYNTRFGEVMTWINSAILPILSVLILLLFNTFLIYKVRTQRHRWKKLGIQSRMETVWTKEQTRLTLTLIAIVGVFLVCVSPSSFSHTIIVSRLFPEKGAMKIFQHIANFLIWVHLSVSFLMYTFINDKFMRAFKRMSHRWWLRLYLDKVFKWQPANKDNDVRPRTVFPVAQNYENVPFACARGPEKKDKALRNYNHSTVVRLNSRTPSSSLPTETLELKPEVNTDISQ